MPNLYNTTTMLIWGNLKERKNGDGCFLLQLSDIDNQQSPWSILIPTQTTEQIHVKHFLNHPAFFCLFTPTKVGSKVV